MGGSKHRANGLFNLPPKSEFRARNDVEHEFRALLLFKWKSRMDTSIVVVSIVSLYLYISTYVQVGIAQYCLYSFLMTQQIAQLANKQQNAPLIKGGCHLRLRTLGFSRFLRLSKMKFYLKEAYMVM